MVFKDLAAHLKTFYGTLLRRGTLVEKHWFGGISISFVKIYFRMF